MRCSPTAVERFSVLAYSCRKATRALNDKQRELVVPFGSAGLIAAFEVRGEVVRIGAIRHQLEQEFH